MVGSGKAAKASSAPQQVDALTLRHGGRATHRHVTPASRLSNLAIQNNAKNVYERTDPDVRLMLRVRDDDAAAFEELVRRYQNRLLRVVGAMAPRSDMAEDLTQEVFLRVYRARKTYEPGAKFSTWLYTIAGNVASNAARTLHRRREVTEADTGTSTSESGASFNFSGLAKERSALMPARQLEGTERARMVRKAIDSLGDRQKMALLLCKFEGMSYAEIAETMNLTEKAVKSLLSRARVNLKSMLEPYVDGGRIADSQDRDPENKENNSQPA